ncbi:hypothetical protein [uncultured Thiocystis sp.]|uniref:hypothetical protein n=1 Tax=uncultured Thiocystis sp. TaxID=1202134 RepID=UPI0025F58C09|nr:hypothetical protein [uncultured Thiocystis sp.]
MRPFLLLTILAVLVAAGCTQETQNKIGRSIQNWTGVSGVMEVYAGDKLVRRFIKIDKLTTASATQGSGMRPYRFGYGVLDANLNGVQDSDEKRVYFEFSDYSTNYVFYGDPGN